MIKIISECQKHGQTFFRKESKNKSNYVCCKCQSEKITNHRKELKIYAINIMGGCCQSCGYNNSIDGLDFHHLDPSKKEFRIGDGNIRSIDAINNELSKCVLLCANCHILEHLSIDLDAENNSVISLQDKCDAKNLQSGILNKYIIKNCNTHGESIYIYETRGTYRCTECMISYSNNKRLLKISKIYETTGCQCYICERTFHRNVIQFHHINPNNKLFGIANALRKSYSLEKILEEIKKCAVLCANCHREVHSGLHPQFIDYNYY